MLILKRIATDEAPMDLLLEADPSEKNVRGYLAGSTCYLAEKNGQAVGICVLGPIRKERAELYNIAVRPDFQKQGIGTKLLEYVIQEAGRSGAGFLELGTGTFGYQLVLLPTGRIQGGLRYQGFLYGQFMTSRSLNTGYGFGICCDLF